MPSESPALLDANVLVYAFHQDSDHHQASRTLLDRAQVGQLALCVTPQVLAEFYAVVTDSRRVSAPREPEEAVQAIRDMIAMPGVTLLSMPAEIVIRWVDLLAKHPVKRGRIFDYQLVASMLANDITKLYTFNKGDFERFTEIQVMVP